MHGAIVKAVNTREPEQKGLAGDPAGRDGGLLLMTLGTLPLTELRHEHWPRVAAIYAEGLTTGDAGFETEVPSWESWHAAHLQDHRFVALRDGEVVGWVAVSPVSERCVYGGVVENSVYVAAAGARARRRSAALGTPDRFGRGSRDLDDPDR
jgi:hypothetical protein